MTMKHSLYTAINQLKRKERMKLSKYKLISEDSTRWLLEFTNQEFVVNELSWFDRALLAECDKSNSIADKLLALETIARKIEDKELEEKNRREVKEK